MKHFQSKLSALEQQIYDYEETYLKEATEYSSFITGFVFF